MLRAFIMMMLGISSIPAGAQTLLPRHNDNVEAVAIDLKPAFGIGLSKTSFNFAGNIEGTNPNILSELIWDKTYSANYGADLTLRYRKFYLQTSINISRNFSGDVSDIDYNKDNRQDPFGETYHSNHKGNGLVFSIQPGYTVLKQDHQSLTLFASFEQMRQRNYLLNPKYLEPNDRNYFDGLNSYYEYNFPNYGIGLAYTKALGVKIQTHLQLEAYYGKYDAYGSWNLRQEFQQPLSYEHRGDGIKIKPSVGIHYLFTDKISLNLQYAFDYYYLQKGRDYLYLIPNQTTISRLNEVSLLQNNLSLGLNFKIK